MECPKCNSSNVWSYYGYQSDSIFNALDKAVKILYPNSEYKSSNECVNCGNKWVTHTK